MKRRIRTKHRSDATAKIEDEIERRVSERVLDAIEDTVKEKEHWRMEFERVNAENKELSHRLQQLRERLPRRMAERMDTMVREQRVGEEDAYILEDILDPETGEHVRTIRRADITQRVVGSQPSQVTPRRRRRNDR